MVGREAGIGRGRRRRDGADLLSNLQRPVKPFALTRGIRWGDGRRCRRILHRVTIGAPVVTVLWICAVGIGIWLPTSSDAV